ncbi:uncharacterized [Tachysurus ichikawai]
MCVSAVVLLPHHLLVTNRALNGPPAAVCLAPNERQTVPLKHLLYGLDFYPLRYSCVAEAAQSQVAFLNGRSVPARVTLMKPD